MTKLFWALALALVAQFTAATAFAVVNINTASKDELIALSGIGPAKAQAILDYRKANGPFKSVDDLKQVKGFRDKLVERLRPELTVASAPAKGAAKSDVADAKAKAGAPAASGRIEDRPRK